MNQANYAKILGTSYGKLGRQRGIAIPLVIVGLVAILAIAGLALDSSHAFVNKTRLQNTADAAALAAAKVYDQTPDTIPSTAAAINVFGLNTNGNGNFEIDSAYDNGDISVTVQFSTTLDPFVSSGVGPYVRVIANGFNMATGLSAIVGVSDVSIGASAVAGPSPTILEACNIAPLLVCAKAPPPPITDPPTVDDFGFDPEELTVLKPGPGEHDDIGPGNYKLLRLSCPGGACIRDAMGGNYDACASIGEDVDTEPGVTAGPTSQGFNTRFGDYYGPVSIDDYPPDVVTYETTPPLDTYIDPATGEDVITWGPANNPIAIVETASEIPNNNYQEYVDRNTPPVNYDWSPSPAGPGVPGRRILALPVADCSGDESGQSMLPVRGFACFFMLQTIGGGSDKNIFGQFVSGCLAGGTPGMDPGTGAGPYIIQLYKDSDSGDS